MSVADQTVFAAFVEAEKKDSTPYKVYVERRICCSRDLDIPEDVVVPVPTDFGNAHIDSPENDEDCQPW